MSVFTGQTAPSNVRPRSNEVMSASTTSPGRPAAVSRRCAISTIAGDVSIPVTARPRRASASSTRPDPQPGSSTVRQSGPMRSCIHAASWEMSQSNAMSYRSACSS